MTTSSNFHAGKFSIITFEEYISIALDAHRVVGIYPEIKNPVFINQHVRGFPCMWHEIFTKGIYTKIVHIAVD